jgi:hypothetical protein
MNDPFLKAHQLLPPFPAGSFGAPFPGPGSGSLIGLARIRAAYPPLFNLAGKLSPVSIRDQMVRGQLLAVRAHEEKLVTNDYPLLVIGAGAAGVTVALTAFYHGHCRPTVVEMQKLPFSLQAGCTTRWINPTQYDWPLEHWKGGDYPLKAAWAPLPWKSQRSDTLAAGWSLALSASRMPIDLNSQVTKLLVVPRASVHPTAWVAEITDKSGSYTRQFGAVVLAVGFGEERYRFSGKVSYVSRPFWSDDALDRPDYGLSVPAKILISGSGDGGLQDFLRITTICKSVEEIVSKLAIPSDTITKLHNAEDWAHRAFHWGTNERHDHPVIRALHEVHRQLSEAVLKTNGTALDGLVRPELPTLRLVHSCDHFANAYPLNRFLTLLVAAYIERDLKRTNPLVKGYRLREIHKHDSSCPGHYAKCDGEDHRVDLEAHADCQSNPTGPATPPDWPKAFNLIIIRHGIDFSPPSRPFPIPFVDLPRQTMAYDYPQ